MAKEQKETNIYFREGDSLDSMERHTDIEILRGGKKIGHIWSQKKDGTTPYPSDKSIKTLNSIQICGFDKMSEVWSCGIFDSKKDCVVYFMPLDEQYHQEKLREYSKYVASFFDPEIKKFKTGYAEEEIVKMNRKEDKDFSQMKSFKEWLDKEGAF